MGFKKLAKSPGRLVAALLLALSALPAAAQTIIHANETVQPGGILNLVGDNLGNASVLIRPVKTDGTLGEATLCSAKTRTDQLIQAQVPTTLANGVWQVWAQVSTTAGNVVTVNAPRVISNSTDECYPGESMLVTGHNLTSSWAATTARFVADDGTSLAGAVYAYSPNLIVVAAPGNLVPNVSYRLLVSNNGVANAGETVAPDRVTAYARLYDPTGQNTAWTRRISAYANNVYNLKTDPRLAIKAAGDGVTDDADALRAAINIASRAGGGIVYLPRGTYKIDKLPGGPQRAVIDVYANVLLKGDGMGQTILQSGMRYSATNLPRDEWFMNLYEGGANGLMNMTIQNLNSSPKVNYVIRQGLGQMESQNVVALGVDFQMGNGWGVLLNNLNHGIVSGCRFSTSHTLCSSFTIAHSKWMRFGNNYAYYRAGRISLNACEHTFVSDSTFERDMNYATLNSIESGGIETSLGQQITLFRNRVVATGPHSPKGQLDSEAIMSQIATIDDMKYSAGVTSATANSITDTAAAWTDTGQWLDPQYATSPRLIVAIVKGKGFGQWRLIDRVAGKTIFTKSDWLVRPDATSVYVVHGMTCYQQFTYRNEINNASSGITHWNGAVDCADVENSLTNASFIAYRACSQPIRSTNGANWENDVNWYNSVIGNAIANNDGFLPAAVSIITVAPSGYVLGNSTLGNEVRNNTLFINSINTYSSETAWTDGYFNLGVVYYSDDPQVNIGSLFFSNQAYNLARPFNDRGTANTLRMS